MRFSKQRANGLLYRTVSCGLALSLTTLPLMACSTGSTLSATSTPSDASTAAAPSVSTKYAQTIDVSNAFSDRDLDGSYDESKATRIALSDGGTTVTGDGATVSGNTVTITAAGTYLISGTLSEGQIKVEANEADKVQLVLSGATVTSANSAALHVAKADKVFLTLADGSENTLATSGAYAAADDSAIDGAVFSRSDLTVNGGGSLAVSSAEDNGIVCKDDVVLASGIATVTAAKHAIQANDSVRIAGGSYTLHAGTDGIHAKNDENSKLGYIYVAGGRLDITAESDGFDANYVLRVDGGTITVSAGDDGLHAESDLTINGGDITVTKSNEGLEGARVTIAGGTQDVVASDDGVNASGDPDDSDSSSDTDDDSSKNNAPGSDRPGTAGSGQMTGGQEPPAQDQSGQGDSTPPQGRQGGQGNGAPPQGGQGDSTPGADESAYLLITGGTLTVKADGDGLDSNGALEVSGGEVYVNGPTSDGDSAIDYGDGSTATITGGTVVALGSTGMAEGFGNSSTQGSMLVSANGNTGDTVTLSDSSGKVLCSYVAQKSFACVLVSAPGVEQGKSYTLKVGSNSIDVTLDGITYSNVSGGMGRPAGPSAGGSPTGSGGGSSSGGGTTAPTGTTNPPGGSQGNRGGNAKDGPGGTTPTSRG
ncbi:MAG: carbohydrate-binding domain-containing protein [Olsenella sp.]